MFDVLKRIKELRENRNWSVYKLSKLSNIPQSSIATWYQKNHYPPIDKIESICNAFGISLSDFFSDNQDSLSLSEEQLTVLAKWAFLNDKEKRAILTVIDTFISEKKENSTQND